MSTRTQRIIIVSDSRLFREGLECLIRSDGRLKVAATYSQVPFNDGELADARADAVLLDVLTAGALDFVGVRKASGVTPKVIALGLDGSGDEILRYAESGAAGYVSRDGTIHDIVEAVTCALRDELSCSRQVAGLLMRRVAHLSAGGAASAQPVARKPLTERERQVGDLLQRGLGNKQIATELQISVSTAKNHVHSILRKLETGSRNEAAALLRAGATSGLGDGTAGGSAPTTPVSPLTRARTR